ncbi:MAG: hypothetical protein R6X02_08090 [Enhygromyxa sp.]
MSYTITLKQWDNLTGVCLPSKGLVADYPSGRNDGFIYVKGAEGGKENFHVHSFETVAGDDMVFTKLLPKSGSFRPPENVDLAVLPLDQWEGAVAGMDSLTKRAVFGLRDCLASYNAVFKP